MFYQNGSQIFRNTQKQTTFFIYIYARLTTCLTTCPFNHFNNFILHTAYYMQVKEKLYGNKYYY
ncbi:hypothetical protein E4N75_08565 [Treponema putidum]|nr:hypothetical protein E4N75_08565 [Treponema putidum]